MLDREEIPVLPVVDRERNRPVDRPVSRIVEALGKLGHRVVPSPTVTDRRALVISPRWKESSMSGSLRKHCALPEARGEGPTRTRLHLDAATRSSGFVPRPTIMWTAPPSGKETT
jgi:hypothetical protein